MLEEKQIERKEIYNGAVLHLVKDRILLPNGKEGFREICLHKGAAAIIPLTDDNEVITVSQYRYAHGRVVLEIPAGKFDYDGEDPRACAIRELKEETGAVADRVISLGVIDTTPALINESIHLFLAEGLHFGEVEPDEDEFLVVEKIPLCKLLDMVMEGKIRDAKTQIAILKAARYKGL